MKHLVIVEAPNLSEVERLQKAEHTVWLTLHDFSTIDVIIYSIEPRNDPMRIVIQGKVIKGQCAGRSFIGSLNAVGSGTLDVAEQLVVCR